MKRTSLLAAVLGLLLTAMSSAAHAETVYYGLDNPSQTASPGDTILFSAVIAEDEGDYFFLNGDTFSVEAPLLLDDSGLFNNFDQFFFDYSFDDYVLFTVTLPMNIPTGTYLGSFTILGGADNGASDVLGTQNFSVTTVNNNPSVTPEPPSLLLLGSGLFGMVAVMNRRRRTV